MQAIAKPGARESVEGMPYVVTLAVAMRSTVFDRASGCMLTSGPGRMPDRVPAFTIWPTNQYIQPEVIPKLFPGRDWRADRDGVSLMDAQRRVPSHWETNHIGGGFDVAPASAGGVELRSLHTWPDKIGYPIDVSAGRQVMAAAL